MLYKQIQTNFIDDAWRDYNIMTSFFFTTFHIFIAPYSLISILQYWINWCVPVTYGGFTKVQRKSWIIVAEPYIS